MPVHITTPLPIFLPGQKKKGKKVALAKPPPLGDANLKLDMNTQLNSGSKMGWVPPGHISSSWYERLNMPIMVLWEKLGFKDLN